MSSPALRPLSPKLEWPLHLHLQKSAPRDSVASASSACRAQNERTIKRIPKGKRVVAPLRSARPRSIRRRTNFLWSSPPAPALLRGCRVRQRGKALFRYFLCPCRLPVRSRAHEFAMPLSRSLNIAACLPDLYLRTRPDRFRLVYPSLEGRRVARSARVHNDHDFGTFCLE